MKRTGNQSAILRHQYGPDTSVFPSVARCPLVVGISPASTLTVPAGKSVSLLFDNSDQMPHNIVVVKPGTAEKVGIAADDMASLEDGYERQFIPDMPEVLFATPLVNAGETYQLDFMSPESPGEYPFICTFPGHWQMMQGVLTVK